VVSLSSVALMTRILQEELARVSRSDFARAAKAFGLPRSHFFHRTLLRPVSVVWVAAWINQISIVFIASFVIEVIFSIPGVGSLLVSAIQQKDYPMLQGILLVNALFFICLSWLSELFYAWIDPRAAAHEG
jgi:peptide/nickel transport system permease protein